MYCDITAQVSARIAEPSPEAVPDYLERWATVGLDRRCPAAGGRE